MQPPPLQRILLVEDDPDIQVMGKMVLEILGNFEVELCISGQKALEQAPTFKPDLILLDIMMPEMDGLTTLQHLRALPDTHENVVIFITAMAQTSHLMNYSDLGVIGVIPKPFNPLMLTQHINQLWSDAAARSALPHSN